MKTARHTLKNVKSNNITGTPEGSESLFLPCLLTDKNRDGNMANAELELQRFFERDGFFVLRSCGSKGAADAVVINGKGPLLVQVKETFLSSINVSRDVQRLDEINKNFKTPGTIGVKFKEKGKEAHWVFCNIESMTRLGKTSISRNDKDCVVKRRL